MSRSPVTTPIEKNNLAGEVEEINEYLASFPSPQTNYQQICKSGQVGIFSSADDCLDFIAKIPSKSSSTYTSVIEKFEKNRVGLESIMEKSQLHALLLPIDSNGPANDVRSFDSLHTEIGSNSGLPGIVLLAGYTSGATPMPVGMELLGKKFSEGTLIEMGYAFEKKGQARIPPSFQKGAGSTQFLSFPLPKLNHLFSRIGWTAYNQVLKAGKREDLTPEKFRKIVQEVVAETLADTGPVDRQSVEK